MLGRRPRAGGRRPLLGLPAAWEGWTLLAAMLTLVFAPKLAGILQVLLSPPLRRAYGGGLRARVSRPGGAAVLVRPGADHGGGADAARAGPPGRPDHPLGGAAARSAGPALGARRRGDCGRRPARAWRSAPAVWLLAARSRRACMGALFCGPLLLAVPFAVVTSRRGWAGCWPARHLCGPRRGRPAGDRRCRRPCAGLAPAALPKLPGRSLSGAAVEAPAAPPVD